MSIRDSVTALHDEPAVLTGVSPSQSSWLNPSVSWYGHPDRWSVELAAGGEPSWPRVSAHATNPPEVRVPNTKVTRIRQSANSISFHVDRVGTPVLVKISYFPNWHAIGADGPWRVTPNLMVVVPTTHDVTLAYGSSTPETLGLIASIGGVVILLGSLVARRPGVTRRLGLRRHGRSPSRL